MQGDRNSASSRVRDWTRMHSDDDKTQQEPALLVQSEIQDDSPRVTGNITVIKKRVKGHGRVNLIKTHFNGEKASVMFDTCSPVSTIHYDDPTQSRIIKIGKKRTFN